MSTPAGMSSQAGSASLAQARERLMRPQRKVSRILRNKFVAGLIVVIPIVITVK